MSMFNNRRYIRHLCACELCNEWAKPGNEFIFGHHWKAYIGLKGKKNGMFGKHHSQETKRKISQKMKGENNPMSGKHHIFSKEHKKKIRDSMRTPECQKKKSKITKTQMQNPRMKMRHKKAMNKPKVKAKISQSMKKYMKRHPKILEALLRSQKIKPTKPEKRLKNRLNHLFPNEYKYVGNHSILIGFKNPDFININGQKKIIEMFGDYWHSKKITGRTRKQEENQRTNHFSKYGFRTLIIWESELKNTKQLKNKLIQFHNI